jgi:hypothetical protein
MSRPKRHCLDVPELRRLIDEGNSVTQIMEILGVHYKLLRRWIDEHSLPVPARLEVKSNPLRTSLGKSWQRMNTPEKLAAIITPAKLEQFWSRVTKGGKDDCWEWCGAIGKTRGYGMFQFGGSPVAAHRASWMIHKGVIPADIYVLHRCDNPPCVNPNHLFLGTNQDNYDDRDAKGRVAHGERAAKAKLTESQVLAIRKSDESDAALGRVYGVHASTIRCARSGFKWARLPGARPDFYEGRRR